MREISRLCSEKAVSGKHETKPRPMAKGQVEGGNALRAARAAEIDAASHRPTAAQKQQQIAELEERAELFGDPVKQSAQAKVLERKWLRFLLVHGEAYKFVARVGPTVELVEHFVAYAFCTRDSVSAIGREGLFWFTHTRALSE